MSSRFSIEQLNEKHRNDVIDLLLDSFFEEEPLAKYLQLNRPIQFAENLFHDALKHQCSFVVYENLTNRFIGLSLNEIQYENLHQDEIIENEKILFILQFLNSMHDNVNLFHRFQTDCLLHIFIINVHRDFRGYGIGSQLIAASIEHAKQKNIKGIYAETTSSYSLNCFQRQDFHIYHQVKYQDSIRLQTLDGQCQLVARSTIE